VPLEAGGGIKGSVDPREEGSETSLKKTYIVIFILGLVAAVVAGLVYLLGQRPGIAVEILKGIEIQGNIHRLKTLPLS